MLLASVPISTPLTAFTTTPVPLLNGDFFTVNLQGNFTTTGGGTSVSAFVQTSLNGGNTWADAANFSFTTASKIGIYNLSTSAATTAPPRTWKPSACACCARPGISEAKSRLARRSGAGQSLVAASLTPGIASDGVCAANVGRWG
jgi:hypothetical protein